MENEFNNLDDLFRDSFSDYSEAPPPAVWPALEKRLDKDKKRRVFPLLRWYWLGTLLAFVTLLGATIIVDMKPAVPAPRKIAASPAHTGDMAGTDKTNERSMRPAHNDNAHVATNVPPAEKKEKPKTRKNKKTQEQITAEKNKVIEEGAAQQEPVEPPVSTSGVAGSRNAPTVGTSVYSYDDFENEEKSKNNRPEATQPIAQQGYTMSTQRKHNIVVAEMLPEPQAHEATPETPVLAGSEPGADVAAGADIVAAAAVRQPTVTVETNKKALPGPTATSTKPHVEKTPNPVAAKPKALAKNDNATAATKPAKKNADAKAITKTTVTGSKTTGKTAAAIEPGTKHVATVKKGKTVATGKAVTVRDLPLAANRRRGNPGSGAVNARVTAVNSAGNQRDALRGGASTVRVTDSGKKKVAGGSAHNSVAVTLSKKKVGSAKQKQNDRVHSESRKTLPAMSPVATPSLKKGAGRAKEEREENRGTLLGKGKGNAEPALPKNSLEDKVNKNGGKPQLAPAITQDNSPAIAKTALPGSATDTSFGRATLSASRAASLQAKRPAINAMAKVPPVIAAKGPAEKTEPGIKEKPVLAADAAKNTAIVPNAGKDIDTAAVDPTAEKDNEPAPDSSAKAITPFMKFVFGIKGGLESGLSMRAGNKVVVAPFIRYNFSERLGLQLQPAIKAGRLSTRIVGTPAAYHSVHPGTGQYELTGTSMLYLVLTGDTLVRRDYTYTEKYDSIVKQNEIGGSYAELELPVLLHYQLTNRLSFYGGLNMVLGKRFSIKEKTNTYTDLTATGQTFSLTRLNEPAVLPPQTGVNYVSSPISSYGGPAFPSDNSNMLRMGYMLGVSYEWKKRWSLEAAVQQCFVQKNMQAGYNLNKALSAPYFRLMVGYRLTK